MTANEADLQMIVGPASTGRPVHRGPWDYWRPGPVGSVELGTVLGRHVASPMHFHQEDL